LVYLAIESFEVLFVGGFEGPDVDAVGSLGAMVGGGGDPVAFGGDSDVAGGSGQFQERGLNYLREAGAGHQPTPHSPPKIIPSISFHFIFLHTIIN